MSNTVDHVSLYRRFRPQRFSEVLGQGHVTKALKNAIINGHVSHLYLFSGPRGTGKTSTARILAKALNCESPTDGEPCSVCESCISVVEGRSFDVEELDAASNSGVDSIRALIATVPNASVGEWKVYIIDEVHMLSNAASSALLKTLEEPPSRVVFVLATTDPHKVLPTIRSRAQHFEFKLLTTETLEGLAKSVSEAAGIDLQADAFEWVANRGSGSARDTLSFLDQVAALGSVPDGSGQTVPALAMAILNNDPSATFALSQRLIADGFDPQRILEEMLLISRGAFVALAEGADTDSSILLNLATKQADKLPNLASIVRFVQGLSAVGPTLKEAIDSTLILQAGLIGLCGSGGTTPAASNDPEVHALIGRVAKLEAELAILKSQGPAHTSGQNQSHAGAEKDEPTKIADNPAGNRERPESQIRDDLKRTPPRSSKSASDPMAAIRAGMRSTSKASEPSGAPVPSDSENALQPLDNPPLSSRDTEAVSSQNEPSTIGSEDPPAPKAEVLHTTEESKAGTDNSPFTRELLTIDWSASILDQLSPKARARFLSGRFLSAEFGKVVIVLPNGAHRDRCIEFTAEVAAAISKKYGGAPVELVLMAEEEVSDPSAQSTKFEPSMEVFNDGESTSETLTDGLSEIISSVFPGAREIDG